MTGKRTSSVAVSGSPSSTALAYSGANALAAGDDKHVGGGLADLGLHDQLQDGADVIQQHINLDGPSPDV
eukprot:CAMPEP_0206334656 /NCGR_PEP_ID=MMETSP0106_2-20121207/25906_1 /ASSEMBLY_ACC=CAM_ASM_000206 /TAXON_ID=81532 /ORGANISM="Acanthoeca-like sp., Strain 10tr" /LENGTH=69 /DNA_ID=CAMNT_0053767571 /DNA_START=20 /DNA_END=229 /DNA_ORIENTATION=+